MSGLIGQDLQVESGLIGFPAGHTLQIVNHTNAYNTDVTSTSYTVVDSASGVDWEPQITMLKSTSKLLSAQRNLCQIAY